MLDVELGDQGVLQHVPQRPAHGVPENHLHLPVLRPGRHAGAGQAYNHKEQQDTGAQRGPPSSRGFPKMQHRGFPDKAWFALFTSESSTYNQISFGEKLFRFPGGGFENRSGSSMPSVASVMFRFRRSGPFPGIPL